MKTVYKTSSYKATTTGNETATGGASTGSGFSIGVHNNLEGIQGGLIATETVPSQYYHLSAAQYAEIVSIVTAYLRTNVADQETTTLQTVYGPVQFEDLRAVILSMLNGFVWQSSAESNGNMWLNTNDNTNVIDIWDNGAGAVEIFLNAIVSGVRQFNLTNPSGVAKFSLIVDANDKLNITDSAGVKIIQLDASGNLKVKGDITFKASIT